MIQTSYNIQPWYLDNYNDDDPKQKIESWINTFLIIGTLFGTDQDNTCRFAVNYLWGITRAWWNSKTTIEKEDKVYQKFVLQTVMDPTGNTVQQQVQLVPINCVMNELVNEFCQELTNKHERIIKDILQMKCCDLKDFFAYSKHFRKLLYQLTSEEQVIMVKTKYLEGLPYNISDKVMQYLDLRSLNHKECPISDLIQVAKDQILQFIDNCKYQQKFTKHEAQSIAPTFLENFGCNPFTKTQHRITKQHRKHKKIHF